MIDMAHKHSMLLISLNHIARGLRQWLFLFTVELTKARKWGVSVRTPPALYDRNDEFRRDRDLNMLQQPFEIGHERFDALLESTIEYLCDEMGLEPQEWVAPLTPVYHGGKDMAVEFLLYDESSPFAFDRSSWETFSMGGSDRSTWAKVEDPDTAFRIRSNSRVISEAEAKSLADALTREEAEELVEKGT